MDVLHDINYSGVGVQENTDCFQAEVVENTTFLLELNMPVEYNGPGGTIGEIRSNNIGVLLISNHDTAGLDSITRVRFTDN